MRQKWSEPELAERFTLTTQEVELLPDRTEPGRLGFAILLKFLQEHGYFPSAQGEVPFEAVSYLARQLGEFAEYEWQSRTIERHLAAIREKTGFREILAKDAEELSRWLANYFATNGDDHLQEVVYQRLRELRIEPPSPDRIQRLVGLTVQIYEQHLHETLAQRLSSDTRRRLDALLRSVATQDAQDPVESSSGSQRGLIEVYPKVKTTKRSD